MAASCAFWRSLDSYDDMESCPWKGLFTKINQNDGDVFHCILWLGLIFWDFLTTDSSFEDDKGPGEAQLQEKIPKGTFQKSGWMASQKLFSIVSFGRHFCTFSLLEKKWFETPEDKTCTWKVSSIIHIWCTILQRDVDKKVKVVWEGTNDICVVLMHPSGFTFVPGAAFMSQRRSSKRNENQKVRNNDRCLDCWNWVIHQIWSWHCAKLQNDVIWLKTPPYQHYITICLYYPPLTLTMS